AATPGATQAMLSRGAVPVYPEVNQEQEESEDQDQESEVGQELADSRQQTADSSIILPIISLEPEPVSRWAKVTTGAGDTRVAGLQMFLNQLAPQPDASAQPNPLTPEQRVQQFCATASITAQKLAGLMAAVPVSVPIAHLIQQTLLPQSQQVHLAEVFMGGLLDANQPNQPQQPTQYYFPEPVREKLIDAVPISKTTQVLDIVSAYISERLGLGIKSFAALIADCRQLEPHQQQTIQPFAEIGLSTLRRLGGDYRRSAEQLATYLNPPPEPTPKNWPPLQEHCYQVATVEVEPLQRFEFETATIQQQQPPPKPRSSQRQSSSQPEWVITKSPGYGWQRLEDLGNGVQLELVEIIGGRFQMGSPEDEPERYDYENPQHEVTLHDFLIGKYPVTQAQWRAVASLPQENRQLNPDPANFNRKNHPVEQVSWEDAVEFCARLSTKTGREYGLPTEAEWEYACRAGSTTPFHFGEMITPDLANYDGDSTYNNGPEGVNRGETTEVGSFPANAWGLYDMHGNVWEWCADDWHQNYVDKPDALKENGNQPWLLAEPLAEQDTARSLRGGSWYVNPRNCRSAVRSYGHPGVRGFNLGFRVVCRAARTLA
ncbi:SUMF1/EgtB/PvdO family nonheme iron enzyme, partial [Pantanalinema rosaneae CENA516]|uniref:formylglycine-generating enzyme family protein n=1 Tax=Pantanalinema rosaneae TaxID=1620701 RepID=UPI003D6FD87B